jgi:polyferredoxin
MNDTGLYLLLADAILVIHFLLVGFVVSGMLSIVVGRLIGWAWIHSCIFRVSHVIVIGIVVAQAWLGRLCPLTILENFLRVRAGGAGRSETFVSYWLHRVLFYTTEPWVFVAIYTVFGGLVLVFLVIDRKRIFSSRSTV